MRQSRIGPTWTVDLAGEGAPEVGHVVHRLTATQQDAGYWRVTSVRPVKHRAPMPAGHTARYRITAYFIDTNIRGGPSVDWDLHGYPRTPKPRGADHLFASPLPSTETQ